MSNVDREENLLLSEEVVKVTYEKYKVTVSMYGGTHISSQDLGAALHKQG